MNAPDKARHLQRADPVSKLALRTYLRKLAMDAAARATTDKWLWLCPVLAVVLAAAILALFGLSLWSALLVALLLVCPALLIWGVIELRRTDAHARRRDRHLPGEQP